MWPNVPWILRCRCRFNLSIATASFLKLFYGLFSIRFCRRQTPQHNLRCPVYFSEIHKLRNGVEITNAPPPPPMPKFPFVLLCIATNLKRRLGEIMSRESSSSSSQQNFRNSRHLLTICCACLSLLHPPPLPIAKTEVLPRLHLSDQM